MELVSVFSRAGISRPLEMALYSAKLQVTIWDQDGTARGPADLQVGGSPVSEGNPLQPSFYATVILTDVSTPISIGTNYIVGNSYGVGITATRTTGGATTIGSFDKSFTVYCTGG